MNNPPPTPPKPPTGSPARCERSAVGFAAEPADRRFRFPKRRRIASGEDFTAIIGSGSFAADETLIVNALPSSRLRRPRATAAPEESPQSSEVSQASDGQLQGPGRLGVTIPRKAGGAVVRNRWKRLIREAYRLLQHELPPGFDFVVRPRRGAVAEFGHVHRSLRRLAVRAASTRSSPASAKRQSAKRR